MSEIYCIHKKIACYYIYYLGTFIIDINIIIISFCNYIHKYKCKIQRLVM